ncbi:DUF1778 domain-containing protein [Pseudomonas syringae pv. actinidiae]|nr:DUF1778 domain-containing protein [Pseudomonas syringae pv. actinidiae]
MSNINIRCPDDVRDLIDRAAGIVGKTRTDYMLDTCSAQARMDILDQKHFIISDKAFDRLTQILEDSENAEPTPALVALMARKRPWSTQ